MNAKGRVKEDGVFKFYEQESSRRGMSYHARRTTHYARPTTHPPTPISQSPFSPVLENFRSAFSPDPTDCPWVSEDE